MESMTEQKLKELAEEAYNIGNHQNFAMEYLKRVNNDKYPYYPFGTYLEKIVTEQKNKRAFRGPSNLYMLKDTKYWFDETQIDENSFTCHRNQYNKWVKEDTPERLRVLELAMCLRLDLGGTNELLSAAKYRKLCYVNIEDAVFIFCINLFYDDNSSADKKIKYTVDLFRKVIKEYCNINKNISVKGCELVKNDRNFDAFYRFEGTTIEEEYEKIREKREKDASFIEKNIEDIVERKIDNNKRGNCFFEFVIKNQNLFSIESGLTQYEAIIYSVTQIDNYETYLHKWNKNFVKHQLYYFRKNCESGDYINEKFWNQKLANDNGDNRAFCRLSIDDYNRLRKEFIKIYKYYRGNVNVNESATTMFSGKKEDEEYRNSPAEFIKYFEFLLMFGGEDFNSQDKTMLQDFISDFDFKNIIEKNYIYFADIYNYALIYRDIWIEKETKDNRQNTKDDATNLRTTKKKLIQDFPFVHLINVINADIVDKIGDSKIRTIYRKNKLLFGSRLVPDDSRNAICPYEEPSVT